MSDAEDIAAINAASTQPQSQSADGVSITERSMDDTLKAIKAKRDLEALSPKNRGLGVRINQIIAPGAGR